MQITGADVLWTNKKALVKWVESFGVSVKDLLGMSDCMREAYDMVEAAEKYFSWDKRVMETLRSVYVAA